MRSNVKQDVPDWKIDFHDLSASAIPDGYYPFLYADNPHLLGLLD